jgi:hexosaminidase
MLFLFGLILLITPAARCAATPTTVAVIPRPLQVEVKRGVFIFSGRTEIRYVPDDASAAQHIGQYLAGLLAKPLGRYISVQPAKSTLKLRGVILLSASARGMESPESYEISTTGKTIQVRASAAAGLFYGVQTLRQMLPPEIESEGPPSKPLEVPCVFIHDRPRYAWRGLMLDCSRTFLPLPYLRNTVDRMALYKLNVLHLHLADDQGWRLEIKKYPELTSVGGHDAARYGRGGGFYTQEEMRALVAYARERNITIVPEIEMPGHSEEVLAAYPELACDLPTPRTFEVHPFWEGSLGHTQPVCAGNDKVYAMYQDILGEVMDLFPSAFIHLGGDEVPKDAWKTCPRCQARIKAEGLRDEEELQSYFMRRIARIIEARGRRMIGWDEILEGGLAPGAAVMSWRGTQGGVAAAQLGHDVVMTPNPYTYFDYTYHTTPTDKVYSYRPVGSEFTAPLAQHILGVQASMWTHIAVTEKAIDYQIYPRLLALAEVAWLPEQALNWSDFKVRLGPHYRRLQLLDTTYCAATATGKKLGEWQASSLSGEVPHPFEWDATHLLPFSGAVEVQVRREDGGERTYVRSVTLLEDGVEISRAVFPGPLSRHNDVNIGWLELSARKPGAHYSLQVTLQGSKAGAVSGSVWIMEPRTTAPHVRP